MRENVFNNFIVFFLPILKIHVHNLVGDYEIDYSLNPEMTHDIIPLK